MKVPELQLTWIFITGAVKKNNKEIYFKPNKETSTCKI